jgi:signal transduction histidine kinase
MPSSREVHAEVLNPDRLAALELTALLDSEPEQAFDRFTTLAHQILGVPVVLISLVDRDRQFFKSQLGLPEPFATARETALTHSFCQHVVADSAPLIVPDARLDPLVQENLAVSEIGVIAYAGVPLRTADNQVIGSFCAIDVEAHQWQPREIEVLNGLAEMVMREVALREVAQKLRVRNEALRIAELRRDDLVHMTIHDLRTPLTSLLSGLQTLDSFVEFDDVSRQVMDITVRGARTLSEMVDTILDVSRGEAGLLSLALKPLDARNIVLSALEQVSFSSQQKSLEMSFEIDADVPRVNADENKLCRVLVNLLGNAIRYTPDGGRICVKVQMNAEKNVLVWSVRDTGVGIAPDDLERIFEKFGQAKHTDRSGASTGLGLTFCKMVIEAHGGQIWAESQRGVGSTFFFELPLS